MLKIIVETDKISTFTEQFKKKMEEIGFEIK
jgi:hypothetical protein